MQLVLNQTKLNLAIAGQEIDATKPTFFFLHGAAMDSSYWSELARFLRSYGFQTIGLDLTGHGRSTGQAFSEISLYRDLVDRTINALYLTNVILVGHSMGALIALNLAAQSPQYLKKLALIGTGATMPVHSKLLQQAEQKDPTAAELILKWSFPQYDPSKGNRSYDQAFYRQPSEQKSIKPGPDLFPGGRAFFEQTRNGVLFQDLTACAQYLSGVKDALKVTCPALLIRGQLEKMVTKESFQTLQQALPKATTQEISEAGHMPHLERPLEISTYLKQLYYTDTL